MQLDLIILSNMGRADGGRETWCYTMLPRWLAKRADLRLRLHHGRFAWEPDSRADLEHAFTGYGTRFDAVAHSVMRGRWPAMVPMARALRRWFARGGQAGDVSMAMGPIEFAMVMAIPALRRTRRVVWLRSIFWDEKSYRLPGWLGGLARRAEAALLARAHVLLCNGDDIAASYARFGLTVEVIRNGVELDRWIMAPPAMETPIHVGFVGRYSDAKGIAAFLDLVRQMKAGPHGDAFAFHTMGFGPHDAEVARLASDGLLTSHGRVAQADMPAQLAKLDVCVAFTRSSDTLGGGGTSNAMMEQMAAGRLMLAWDNAIFRQYLHDGNALLVPQDDVAAAACALETLLKDRDAARVLAKAGQASILPYGVDVQLDRVDRAVFAASGEN